MKKLKDKIKIYNDWLVNGNGTENIPGLVARGIDRKAAEKLADDLVDFGRYCFNRSHAVAYAIQTATTAWYKARYPHEYMCATLSSYIKKKKEKIVLYIEDCKALGIPVQKPSVNLSEYEFSLAGDSIVFGFGAIKDLGYASIDMVEERRRNGPYPSLNEFFLRTKNILNRKAYVALLLSGSLDEFLPRQDLNARYELLQQLTEQFGGKDLLEKYELPSAKNMTNSDTEILRQLAMAEVDHLGLQFSQHLLTGKANPCTWLEQRFETTVIIENVITTKTKKGKPMLIIEVDSLEGRKKLMAFDDDGFEKLKAKLTPGGIRIVELRGKPGMNGWMYTLQNIKYFREEPGETL